MKSCFNILALVTGLTTGVFSAFTPSLSAAMPLHLERGLQLLDEINSAHHLGVFTDSEGVAVNGYGGSWHSLTNPSFIRFADFDNGVLPANYTTCSPFVTHLLRATYNWDWKKHSFIDPVTLNVVSVASPSSYRYIALMKANLGFVKHTTRLNEVLPGDILSWWQVGTTSGHTSIVISVDFESAKPYPSDHADADPTLAGTTYYEVEVLDSAAGVHTNDSRVFTVDDVSHVVSGLGSGTMGILVDANFELVGYTWSLPTSNYVTGRKWWLGGLHNRLRRLPEFEAVFGRLPVL